MVDDQRHDLGLTIGMNVLDGFFDFSNNVGIILPTSMIIYATKYVGWAVRPTMDAPDHSEGRPA